MAKGKMVSSLRHGEDINAMLRALRKTKAFEIDRDSHAETIVVKHLASGTEVLRAIGKGNGYWITRMMNNLFDRQPGTEASLLS
jgi:hypothetical protein